MSQSHDASSSTDIADAESLYNDVVALVARDPDNEELLDNQVHGAMHLISVEARNKRFDKAQSLFDETAELVERKNSPRLRAMYADIAVGLSAQYGDAGLREKAETLYAHLKRMVDRFPDEGDLREGQARLAFNLLIDYERAGLTDLVEKMHAEVTTLADRYPEHLELQVQRGRILQNVLYNRVWEKNDIGGARALYRELSDLVSQNANSSELRELQADAAVMILAKMDNE
jgi:hypothetical protein